MWLFKISSTRLRKEMGHKEQQNRGDGRGTLQCLICGKDFHKKDYLLYQVGRPHVYSS